MDGGNHSLYVYRNLSNSTSSTVSVEAISILAVLVFLCFVGVVGNLMVIIAISLDKKMRKSAMNIVLLNLAVADFSNLLVCLPDIAFGLIRKGWLLPDFMCPLVRFLEFAFIYCSVMMQLAVCGERFTAINFPLKVSIYCTQRVFLVITIAIWSLAFLFATPQAFHEAIKKPSGKQCLLANNLIPYVDEFQFVVFYLIPMVITICTYGQVSYVLWSSSLHLQEGRQRSKDSENDRTRKSVVKMLIACVTVYFSCYTPINLLFLASKLTTKRLEVPKAVRLLLNLLAYACSCVNPFVYSIFSRKFRLRFRQLLTCRKISSLPIEPSAMFSQSACVAQRRLTAIDTAQNRLVYLPLRRESGQDKCSAIRRNVTVNSTNRTQLVTIKDELQEFAELKCQSRD